MAERLSLIHQALPRVFDIPGRVADGWGGSPTVVGVEGWAGAVRRPEGAYAGQPGLTHLQLGQGRVSCRIDGRVALVVGGPQCDPGDEALVLHQAVHGLRESGVHRIGVFPVREGDLRDVLTAGFQAVPVGAEGWLDLTTFGLAGGARAALRQMVNRALGRGIEVKTLDAIGGAEAMMECWEAWLAAKSPRWGLGWWTGQPLRGAHAMKRVVGAFRDGRLEAFCTVMPAGGASWAVDVLCRRPDAAAGAMEAVLVEVIQRLQREGAERLSLGPSPMFAWETPPPGALGRMAVWARESDRGERWFGFRGLYDFKNKFRPAWQPVSMGLWPDASPWTAYRVLRVWGLRGQVRTGP